MAGDSVYPVGSDHALKTLADYKDTLDGGVAVAVGNGSSLLNTPLLFLESYPTFGCNFVHWWAKRKLPVDHDLYAFCPDVWCCLDVQSLEAVADLPADVPKFASPRFEEKVKSFGFDVDGVIFEALQERIDGLGWVDGTNYGTTLIFAAHLADYFGADTVLLVGFDCTRPKSLTRKDRSGLTGAPHFYDPDREFQKQKTWDKQFHVFSNWMKAKGKRVLNLSDPTMATVESDLIENWM